MMTSREIVYANLEHRDPPRPAMNFKTPRMNDFVSGGLGASETVQPRSWEDAQFGYYEDAWGNIWRYVLGGSKRGEVHEQVLKDWSQLDTLRLPDFDNPRRYAPMRQRFAEAGDKFKLASMPGWVFATSRYLRKMEIYFVDLLEYRAEIDRLHEIVTTLLVKVVHLAADAGAEGIMFAEDLGIQDRPLIGPAMWRDVFMPHYLRLTGAAHERGMKVFMHSCGYNWALIDSLAEAGIDAFQFDQPAAYDMPALADKFRAHRVALYSPVDIQKVMPTGDRRLIESEAARMVETFRGFLIAKSYGDLPGIGVQSEWDEWAYQAILRASGVNG